MLFSFHGSSVSRLRSPIARACFSFSIGIIARLISKKLLYFGWTYRLLVRCDVPCLTMKRVVELQPLAICGDLLSLTSPPGVSAETVLSIALLGE